MEIKTDGARACASCLYVRRTESTGVAIVGRNSLACRRFPPQIATAVTGGGLQVFAVWVPVGADDWCGEHVPRVAS